MAELTVEQLTVQVTELQKEKSNLAKQVTELEAIVEELNSENSRLSTILQSGSKFPIFKVGKKTYQFTAPKFDYQGKKYLAEDVKDDSDLAKTMVKIGEDLIVELKTAE